MSRPIPISIPPSPSTPVAATEARSALREIAALGRTRRVAGVVLAIATLGTASYAAGLMRLNGSRFPVPQAIVLGAYDVGAWMATCAVGAAVGWLLPLRGRPALRHAAMVAAFALAASVARVALQLAVNRIAGTPNPPFDKAVAGILPIYFLICCTFAGLGVGLRSMVRERELTAAVARMEAELARERMRTVFGAIRPHRVLATLAAIERGMEGDAPAADRLLVSLGELLRLSLQRSRAGEVTLADELRYVAALLEVEAHRAGRPVALLRQEIDDRLLEARLLPGGLSALVEAALEAAGPAGPAPSLTLAAETDDGVLRLRLADDVPLPAAARTHGAGLAEHASLRYEERPEGGAVAHLALPLRLDGEAAR